MNSNQQKDDNSVTPNNHESMEVFVNMEDKKRIFRIYDLIPPVTHSEKQTFDISEKVFSGFHVQHEGLESITISLNRLELLEWTYSIVNSSIKELQRVNYNTVNDLLKFNLNTLPLFLTPIDVTNEEMDWVSGFITKNENSEETEVEIKLPNDAERNYLVNVRRILKENNSNPDFNQSILNFFVRTRDLD